MKRLGLCRTRHHEEAQAGAALPNRRLLQLVAMVCAVLVWGGVALATPTPQQRCDFERMRAWKTYLLCMDRMLAKNARGALGAPLGAFTRCRHKYFRQWTAFQNPNRTPSLVGSTCMGSRFTDNGDGTVTDHLTELVWEKKTHLDGTDNPADLQDADNTYNWADAYLDFRDGLNVGGFAGQHDWRLPSMEQFQTILLDFACTGAAYGPHCHCPTDVCVDSSLDPTNTRLYGYWSDTAHIVLPQQTWALSGDYLNSNDTYSYIELAVRAVRGGF